MMQLKDILHGISHKASGTLAGVKVPRVTCDSRSVKSGDLFFALKGYTRDGYAFIGEAIKRGARIVVAEKDFKAPEGVYKVLVRDTRTALPLMADNFYCHPSQKLSVVGVTGTNGKTTVTYIVENILKHAGKGAGVIGTINYRLKNRMVPAKNTTPGPLELQTLLAEMVRDGTRYAIIEISSHSLDQHRVDRVLFDVAAFTNVTSEHLDYHRTLKNYFNAKAKLFGNLKKSGVAVLNKDDAKVFGLRRSIKNKVMTYSVDQDADIHAESLKLSAEDSVFTVRTPRGPLEVRTGLIGRHNVSNILASVAICLALSIRIEPIKKGIETFTVVPGRLEVLDVGQPFKVFVDFAHTEDALYNILSILREVAKESRIITVFGCGGDRDRMKRPLMGNVACKFSDKVMITSDNPRFEDPLTIIREIESGIQGKYSNYNIIANRRQAIEKALGCAARGDIVVIAGKGHEKYQIIKDMAIPFDDCEVAKAILKKKYSQR